jgi:cysteine desulfurase
MKPIYLDYNSTTPIDPEVVEAMRPYLEEHFGNPSSSHWYGAQTRQAVENARQQVARLLNCRADEIIFTGGGSEANNMAIKGIAFANRQQGNHIITSAIEHPAVTEVCRYLEENGFRITYLPVDEYGRVDPVIVEKAITPQTILITIMHANNEVGTIQPISKIAKIAKANGIAMHTDAAQSLGKIPAWVDELGVDMLSVAGHKLYAPKGIGALYVRRGIKLQKLIHGADHEQNRRAGTENVLEIVGLGKACEIAGRDLEENMPNLREKRDRLYQRLAEALENIRLNGPPGERLPNTASISFRGIEADVLLSKMGGVAASAGAACHADAVTISATLSAMKVPLEYAKGTIRFSAGKMTSTAEIDKVAQIVIESVKKLRSVK